LTSGLGFDPATRTIASGRSPGRCVRVVQCGSEDRACSERIPSIDESSQNDDGAVARGFDARVPSLLLHCQHRRIVVPSAIRTGSQGSGTGSRRASIRVQNSNGFPAVEILVHAVPCASSIWILLRAGCAIDAHAAVAAQGDEGAVGEMHARGAEGVGHDVHGDGLMGLDVPECAPRRMSADLRCVSLGFVEDVHRLLVAQEHLKKIRTIIIIKEDGIP
jgi:hypothetical protein